MHSTVFEDNNGALGLAKSPRTTPRMHHIAMKYYFFVENSGEGKGIMTHRAESKDHKAYVFTKVLPAETFQYTRKLLAGW